jgi:hypothetical protein
VPVLLTRVCVCARAHQVAGSPDLYPLLVELNPFPTLLACVGHENVDIAADTLELLREMTDTGTTHITHTDTRSTH